MDIEAFPEKPLPFNKLIVLSNDIAFGDPNQVAKDSTIAGFRIYNNLKKISSGKLFKQ